MHSTIPPAHPDHPVTLTPWERLCATLPPTTAAIIQTAGGFTRIRGIASPLLLLRIILVAALAPRWSFRTLGLWCLAHGLADLSHVALLRRMRTAHRWLGPLLHTLLALPRTTLPPVRIAILDATVITKPASRGTDWRIHLAIDLASQSIVDAQVTDATGAEGFARWSHDPTTILVADRGYAYPASLRAVLAANQPFVVRANLQNLRLFTAAGTRLAMTTWLTEVACHGQAACSVWLEATATTAPMRVVATALPQEVADRARATKRRMNPTARAATIMAAGFVILLTNLAASVWDTAAVVAVYRLRWQIELRIKRLKQLGDLGTLRVRRDPDLGRSVLLARVVAAVLVDRQHATMIVIDDPAWGVATTPISRWRVEQWAWTVLRERVLGVLPPDWTLRIPQMRRLFGASTTRRPHQASAAVAWFAAWNRALEA